MTDFSGIAQIILAIATLVGSVGSVVTVVLGVRNGKKSDKNAEGIAQVHQATNGMKDALVAGALKEGHADGVADERASHERVK